MNQDKEDRQCGITTDLLGTASSFKLKTGIYWLNSVGSPKNSVHRCYAPATFAMSLNNANESPFLTFVSLSDDVTVFSPNEQGPIGKIVRRKGAIPADDEADIYCFTTNTKFTLKSVRENSPATMKIVDSNGSVLGTAGVSKWETSRVYCATATSIEHLTFHVIDGIPEPIKTMLLVAFTNWARWSKHEDNGPFQSSLTIKLIVISILIFFGLPILAFLIVKLS